MYDPQRYQPTTGRFDEAVLPDGAWRPGWRALGAAIAATRPGVFAERQRQADRMLDAEGAGHLVHELVVPTGAGRGSGSGTSAASRPWRLDPVPMVIEQGEFDLLARAVAQRTRLLEAILVDLYGGRTLVRTGVVPAHVLYAMGAMRPTAAQQHPVRWLVHHAVDLVRTVDGTWRVVQDLTDAPTGLGYGLLNRSVMSQVMAEPLRASGTMPIVAASAMLRRGLADLAPASRTSPRTVVLTGGPEHSSYVEHSYLAVQMGFHLAEGADLVVRRRQLWLRALNGLEPVDVVYRRLEDASVDPLDGGASGASGVPALTWAAQGGGVALGNAYGAGLVEAAALAPYLGAAAQSLLGESLLLDHLGADEQLASTPVTSMPGSGGATGPLLVPGRVVVRLHAIVGPDGVSVVPGGAGRVLSDGDHPTAPTAQRTKDVWVVGERSAINAAIRVSTPQQVDFGASVPKRAADALYWTSRAAERAEVAARTARVVGAQLQQDPHLVNLGNGDWSIGAVALLRSARGASTRSHDGIDGAGAPLVEQVRVELAATRAAVAAQIVTLVQEATSVREFLSTTTGRLLGRLAQVRADLIADDSAVDDLDMILVDLAAFAGLATESTVRGPAWRFLDLGRRIERALAVLGSVEAAAGAAVDPLAFQPLIEAVLSSNESLVAYRRRYRSDVELDAVIDLLIRDDANPRGLAFQLDRLREHSASLDWAEGSALIEQASIAAMAQIDQVAAGGRRLSVDGLVLAVRGPLLALDAAVVARWFADPVNPMVLGPR